MNLGKATDTVIEYSFYILIFLVPIIWLPVNYELFEFNKMTLTYLIAAIIFGAWLTKVLYERKFYIRRTPIDVVLLIFLSANILSTIFSIDWHMSVFGYYSRFNGGLLSTITYIFLYFAFVTHLDKQKMIKFLLVGFASAVIVSIYAVLQHPNPLFHAVDGTFKGIDQGYWDLNSHIRSFSFLGQPNWLAAYLSIFFFIGVSFLIIYKKAWQKLLFLVSNLLIFLGFTFAYSRGGTVGFITGLLVFIFFFLVRRRTTFEKIKNVLPFIKKTLRLPALGKTWHWLAALVLVMILVNFFFGNAIARRGASVEVEVPTITQLEIEGTQTGKIRLIVWRGAFEIFKNNPIFGTGVETFANAYYLYRPAEHNTTHEWDFLYNKAHNEYLNYLSTTGLIGTISYLSLIILFSYLVMSWLYKNTETNERYLTLGIFAAYASYLVQNIFGFSVVILSILFFLTPVIFFLLTNGELKTKILLSEKYFDFTKSSLWSNITYGLGIILTLLLILAVLNSWIADFYFAKGLKGKDGNEIYNNLQNAARLRPDEPLFLSELAGVEASISAKTEDNQLAKQLSEDSIDHIEQAISISPNDLGVWRNNTRVYFELSKADKSFIPNAIQAAEKTAKLAPTDAKILYNLALFYLLEGSAKGINKSNQVLSKVLDWRPVYNEARLRLAKNYIDQEKFAKAKKELENIIDRNPAETEALDLLQDLD